MSRYELSISMDYVSNWTYIEAIREIFQNALDEQTVNKDNKMFVEYDKDSCVLRIGNKKGCLDKNSLLLGVSSKRDDSSTIGQHGEGYKIATVVLLRNGYNVKIYNYGKKEVWIAKKVNSRRYSTVIPVFDIDKYVFKSVPDNNLVFEITGITEEMFNSVVSSNIHLMKMYGVDLGSVKSCTKGSVLLDDKFKGQIYVNGLYVRTVPVLRYGYNFSPELIKLDRDRDLIENFNLKWSIGVLLRSLDSEFVSSMLDTSDAEFLFSGSDWEFKGSKEEVANAVYHDYISKYGEGTIPCIDTDNFNSLVKQGMKPVMISKQRYLAIKESPLYRVSSCKEPTLSSLFSEWYDEACNYFPEEFKSESEYLINRVKSVL